MKASKKIRKYFEDLQNHVQSMHVVAVKARAQNIDPAPEVEIRLASSMAERVEGLISVIAPQILGAGVKERIMELESEFGVLDWRVALRIAEEVAKEVFCKFKDRKTAMEVGIRTGFAYVTVGVVSSPLDGIIGIDIKKRLDGKTYFCVNFAGPIRNAGGTAAAVSVIITDYVRKKMGYGVYDPQPDEIKRAHVEVRDYHERISPRQYFPSEQEHDFLVARLPVEIGADPSETVEVSNFKDLPRVSTNFIRSGFCLMLTDCIPLKAPKLWKQLGKWGHDFSLEQWDFLEEYLKLQKKAKAKSEDVVHGVSADHTYLKDLVAGRPVLGFPLQSGGFRIRYGRCRTTGLSAQAIHPASMAILDSFIASGTQLKLERPGKAASISSCSTIEGPIVKLQDGSVVRVDSVEQGKELAAQVTEILYLGDVLQCFGDYVNRAHPLVPVGYCEEWWQLEAKKAGAPLDAQTASDAIQIAQQFGIPLHPRYCYHWNAITIEQCEALQQWIGTAKNIEDRMVLENGSNAKRALELIGVPHTVNDGRVVIEKDNAVSLRTVFAKTPPEAVGQTTDTLSYVQSCSAVALRDKSGTFLGARMGRPEKAKMRKMTGSPHMLFPVGSEGGKMRSLQSALTAGKIVADFPFYTCMHCKADCFFPVCLVCGQQAKRQWLCGQCGYIAAPCDHGPKASSKRAFPLQQLFPYVLKKLRLSHYPALIKGIKGTSNVDHMCEHIAKGVLRAKYDVYVNKDGTIRYDGTQLPLTHFTPQEIGTSVEQLNVLGYTTDVNNQPLVRQDQVVEIFPQDVILPDCDSSNDESGKDVLFRVTKFVDEELISLYGLDPFYGLKASHELVGHLVIFLAPHTSAGIVGRVIGFSHIQSIIAHPYMHSATRRDCDGDESCVLLLMDAFLNFSKAFLPGSRGATMDTPLVLTTMLNPSEVDDMVFDMDISWEYPLQLYEAAKKFAMPWEVEIPQIKKALNSPAQYEGHGFTHATDDINRTVRCSAYKLLPSMEEKLKGQMALAEKIRAVDAATVATMVIDKHFMRDAKGNLRQFSTQVFRCVKCNVKFRRPPLKGCCTQCGGRLLFTIAQGSVVKYVEPMTSLATKYQLDPYLRQTIDLLRGRIEGVFGRDAEKQTSLGAWFG